MTKPQPLDPIARPIVLTGHDWRITARVQRVIDGDTLVAGTVVDVGFGATCSVSVTLRVAGLYCPETTGPDKTAGLAARDHAASVFPPGTPIMLATSYDTTFARWVADVQQLNPPWTAWATALIAAGHGKATP